MIDVNELIYEFELKLNSLDRQDNQQIFIENKLIHLNNAQMTWIKSKLNPNNLYKAGYESFRKRIDDLQILKVNNYEITVKKEDNEAHPNYSADLSSIKDYMFYISSFAKAKTKKCSDTISVDLIKEGELSTKYSNDNYSPSFIWRKTIGTMGSDKLYVYVDDEFTIENVRLTYLRIPKKIDKEGYIDFNGKDSVNQDCELPYYAKNDIVDLAVKYAAQSIGDQLQTQMAKERQQENE
jgi:hypothetical protein